MSYIKQFNNAYYYYKFFYREIGGWTCWEIWMNLSAAQRKFSEIHNIQPNFNQVPVFLNFCYLKMYYHRNDIKKIIWCFGRGPDSRTTHFPFSPLLSRCSVFFKFLFVCFDHHEYTFVSLSFVTSVFVPIHFLMHPVASFDHLSRTHEQPSDIQHTKHKHKYAKSSLSPT